MADTEHTDSTADDLADIAYVRDKRKQIVTELMVDGKPPEDPKAMGHLLQALDGLDKSAISRQRLKTDNKKINSDEASRALMSALLQQISPGTVIGGGAPRPDRGAPVLPDGLNIRPVQPGEMDVGTHNVNYSQFMERARALGATRSDDDEETTTPRKRGDDEDDTD